MTWRRFNMIFFFVWLAAVPISLATGWVYSLAYISLVSIYANAGESLGSMEG